MTPEQESLRGKYIATKRWHPDDTQTLDKLGSELKASRLAEQIKRTVDTLPPLSQAQRNKLALLLRGDAA